MTKATPDWAAALRALRHGKTKPLGELLRHGDQVPTEVTTMLGLMLAPAPKDHGPLLKVQFPKRWNDEKTFKKQSEAIQVHDEIVAALKSNGGQMKNALSDVGQDRKRRRLHYSRAFLLKCWTQNMDPGFLAAARRLLLEIATLPGMREYFGRETSAGALPELKLLGEQPSKRAANRSTKKKGRRWPSDAESL